MSQYAFSGNTIINQSFPDTRTALNAAYAALASNSSGDNDPTSVAGGSLATVQHQWWYDSTNNKLMLRNDANNAWIEIATIDETSGNVLSITTQGLTIGATALTATGTEINQLSAITRGSILYGNASGATARLAAGGASTVLTSDGTDISWAAAAGGGGAMELISLQTPSSVTLVSFTGFDSSKYNSYKFDFSNIRFTADDRPPYFRTSSDGGSNYDAGSSDYKTYIMEREGNGYSSVIQDTNYARLVEESSTSTSHRGVSGTLTVFRPDSSSFTDVHGYFSSQKAINGDLCFYISSNTRMSTAAVNAIQFGGGTFASGTIAMYGLKKS